MPPIRSSSSSSSGRRTRSLNTRPIAPRPRNPLLEEDEEEIEITYENVTFPADSLGEPFKPIYASDIDNEGYEERVAKVARPREPRPPRLETKDMEVVRTLGQSLCKVLLVKSRRAMHYLDTPHVFALKAIPRKYCRQSPVKLALEYATGEEIIDEVVEYHQEEHTHEKKAEIGVLSQLDWNPFVLGLYDTFFDSVNLYLALEYAPGGTLRSLLRKSPGGMKACDALFYFSNLVCALEFLHDNQIVHRDLKPENLLLNADGYLCLTDFGSALPTEDFGRHGDTGGTRDYQAPEWHLIPMQQEVFPTALDWWGAGCMLFEMATGKMAFFEERNSLAWPPGAVIGLKLEDVIVNLLELDAAERLGSQGTDTVQAHLWLAGIDWDQMHNRQYLPPYLPKPVDVSRLWHSNPLPEVHQAPGLVIEEPALHLTNDDRFPERWA